MENRCGRINYPPVIEDTYKLGREDTRLAGCTVCWGGCLRREDMGNFPKAWSWMDKLSVLTDETLICVDGQNENSHKLGLLPRPMQVGETEAMFSSHIHERRRTTKGRRISRFPALSWFENYFFLPEGGPISRTKNSISSEDLEEPAVEAFVLHGENQPLFYLPVHDACLSLLEHYLGTHPNSAKMSGLVAFYDTVTSSFQQWSLANNYTIPREFRKDYDEIEFAARVGSPPNVFSYESLFRWEFDRESYFFANPLDVGTYTLTLIANAPRLSDEGDGTSTSNLDRLLSELPQELFDQILEDMCPLGAVSRTCNRVVSYGFWKDLLITPGVISLLWDLDRDSIVQTSENIDWEMFVRMLAQPDAFEQLPNSPKGLINRHSIWRSLDDRALATCPTSIPFSEQTEGTAPESLVCDPEDQSHIGDISSVPERQINESIDGEDGCYTSVEVEWVRRTAAEIELAWSEDEYESGHWTVRWHQLPIDEKQTL